MDSRDKPAASKRWTSSLIFRRKYLQRAQLSGCKSLVKCLGPVQQRKLDKLLSTPKLPEKEISPHANFKSGHFLHAAANFRPRRPRWRFKNRKNRNICSSWSTKRGSPKRSIRNGFHKISASGVDQHAVSTKFRQRNRQRDAAATLACSGTGAPLISQPPARANHRAQVAQRREAKQIRWRIGGSGSEVLKGNNAG